MFQSMKIKGRLLSAFGVVLFLFSILAGCSYFSINRIKEICEVENTFHKISTTALQMRRSEKDFFMTDIKNAEFMKSGNSKFVSDMSRLVATQDSILNSLLESKWPAKLDIYQDLTSLKTHIETYHRTFRKIAIAYRKRGFKDFGYEGDLRVAIRAIEESDYKINMIQLLRLRRIEKDFFIDRDTGELGTFTAAITTFIDEIDNGGKGQDLKIKISTYEEKFNALVKAEETIGLNDKPGLLGEMRNNIYKIEPTVEKLETLINVHSQKMVFETILIFTLIFLFELIIGSVLAIRFSNRYNSNFQYVRKPAIALSGGVIPEHSENKATKASCRI